MERARGLIFCLFSWRFSLIICLSCLAASFSGHTFSTSWTWMPGLTHLVLPCPRFLWSLLRHRRRRRHFLPDFAILPQINYPHPPHPHRQWVPRPPAHRQARPDNSHHLGFLLPLLRLLWFEIHWVTLGRGDKFDVRAPTSKRSLFSQTSTQGSYTTVRCENAQRALWIPSPILAHADISGFFEEDSPFYRWNEFLWGNFWWDSLLNHEEVFAFALFLLCSFEWFARVARAKSG